VTRRVGTVAMATCGMILVLLALAACGGSDPGGPGARNAVVEIADFEYAIPAGTGARLDRGEEVELLPAVIEARVGQTIRIVNDDDRDYLLGPFPIGAGQTLTQEFTQPGTFIGECVVHPSGELVLEVNE
jgi:hypothetical protein